MSTTSALTTSESSYFQLDTSSREPVQDMGKDEFIQLLVTQLKYQDPFEPMDNTEMVAQLAQFSALEQMMNVAQATEKQMIHSMIGDYVEYSYTNDEGQTEYYIGKVDYVKLSGSEYLLGLGDHEISLDNVYQVYDADNITTNSSPFEVIGKTVQAITTTIDDTTGLSTEVIIEGEVLGIKLIDSEAHVIIGTGEYELVIPFDDVQTIVEKPSVTGRYVVGTVIEDGEEIEVEGYAEYISIDESNTYIYVNGYFVKFEDITDVRDSE
ncbi:MAG: hypothetical protein ATN36_00220 [Epulopiscium sp. Nele67-Bin005]|nr:MAG: hypothetical protein ATN36_00220 [Epulopiscium sp. Nele67-Bin005]